MLVSGATYGPDGAVNRRQTSSPWELEGEKCTVLIIFFFVHCFLMQIQQDFTNANMLT